MTADGNWIFISLLRILIEMEERLPVLSLVLLLSFALPSDPFLSLKIISSSVDSPESHLHGLHSADAAR